MIDDVIPELDEGTELEDGSTVFEELTPEDEIEDALGITALEAIPEDANLVDYLSTDFVNELAKNIIERVEADEQSREDWIKTYQQGIKLLGLKIEQVSDPFEGACAANHPLILEAAVKFVSKVQPNLLPPGGPCKADIKGVKDVQVLEKANRVVQYENFLLTQSMPEFRPGTLRMLFSMALCGIGFKKMYFRPDLGRPYSEHVRAEDFIASQHFTDLHSADCYTHRFPLTDNELQRRIYFGMYRPLNDDIVLDLGDVKDAAFLTKPRETFDNEDTGQRALENEAVGVYASNLDEIHEIYEHHCYLTLPDPYEFDVPLPFIVTVHKDSAKILSIRKNWRQGDAFFRKRIWFVRYPFFEGFGFYGLGLIHMLWSQQLTLTSGTRSLVDSASLANLQGGFVTKTARLRDTGPIRPGEWREVEGAMQDLAKSFFPIPYKEPPNMLFQMLSWIDGRAGKFADSMDQVVNNAANYGPTGTTMALLEASAKMETAIQQNLHNSQKDELQLLHDLIGEHAPQEDYPYRVGGVPQKALAQDFDGSVDVIPVSDPNSPSSAHRAALAQAKMGFAAQLQPGIVNQRVLAKEFFISLGSEDIENLVPEPQEAQPQDPVTDLQSVVAGLPIKAFPGQDHKAHIAVKTSFIENPTIGGGNPVMASLVPIVQANIREHQILQFQEEMQAQIKADMMLNPALNPQDPKVLGALMENAAEEILANAKEQQTRGTPEDKLAEAALISAKTESRRQQFEEKEGVFKAIDTTTKRELDDRRLDIQEAKIAADITKDKAKPVQELGMFAAKEAIKGLVEEDRRGDAEAKRPKD